MSKVSPRILYFPEFEDSAVFEQQLARAAWYLAPLSPEQIIMPVACDVSCLLSDIYTPEIVDQFSADVPDWIRVANTTPTMGDLLNCDVLICWDGLQVLENLGEGAEQRLRKAGISIFDVDHKSRVEGSRYIDISHRYFANDEEVTEESHIKFKLLEKKFEHVDRAFLFCSGPEVRRYKNYRFDSGINIICNSVINDEELIREINPDIQIFGDPIFHFGCSVYAHEFRKRLAQTQAEYGFVNLIPIKYYNLFVYWQPELADVTIAVPFDLKIDINLQLSDKYALHTTDNILTFLMLPIGSSLANEIYLLGCDGRPVDQNNYFWKHNEKTQFVSQMDNIQQVHPTFFTVDYDDYYLRHCDKVEQYFSVGERLGKRFYALTPSYIPAIKSREHICARFESDGARVAIEPLLKQENMAEAKEFHGYDEKEVTLVTPRGSPGDLAILSKDTGQFAKSLQQLMTQLELSRLDISLAQRFGNIETVRVMYEVFGESRFHVQVVLQDLVQQEDVELLADISQADNFEIQASSQEVANSTRQNAPQLIIPVVRSSTLVANTTWLEEVEVNDNLEEALLDLAFEVKKGVFRSSRYADTLNKLQRRVTDQTTLLVRMDEALRSGEEQLARTHDRLEKSLAENEKLRGTISRFEKSNKRLVRQVEKGAEQTQQMMSHHNEVLSDIRQLQESQRRLGELVDDGLSSKTLSALQREINHLQNQCHTLFERVEGSEVETQIRTMRVESKMAADDLHNTVTTWQVKSQGLHEKTLENVQDIEDKYSKLADKVDGLYIPQFKRTLDDNEIGILTQLARRLAIDVDSADLQRLASRFAKVEDFCIGEVPSNACTLVARSLCILSFESSHLSVLEIGCRSGIFTAYAWDSLRHRYKSLRTALVDPLLNTVSEYRRNNPFTPAESIVKQNLQRVGMDKRKLSATFSSAFDQDVLAQTRKSKFHMITVNATDGSMAQRLMNDYSKILAKDGIAAVVEPVVTGEGGWISKTGMALFERIQSQVLYEDAHSIIVRKS